MRSDLRAVVGRGLGIVHVVAGLAAAVIVVALWLAPERLGVRADADGRVGLPVGWIEFAGFCGLGLLIVDGLFLLYGRGPREPLRHIVSETRDGSVSITREAVENGLRHAGEGLAEVARTRVSIRQPAARRLVVHAQFWAPESSSIPTASQALRQALRTRFEAMVRPPEGVRVDYELEFLGFTGRASRRATEAPAADSAAVPFTGPQYPIEEEDELGGPRQ
jgi:hypothetical protein